MATYAAMVDRMDQSIGRFINELKRLDQFDNTLIMFLSDNGGCAEFMAEGGWAQFYPDTTFDGKKIAMGNIADILPTILQATGAAYQQELDGHQIQPCQGESFMALSNQHAFNQKPWQREQPIFFEHEGYSAIRLGDFKLVRLHNNDWELYHMIEDRTELNNLIKGESKRAANLLAHYNNWAENTGVMDWNIALLKLLTAWGMDSQDG